MILTPFIQHIEQLAEKYDLAIGYAEDNYTACACPGSRTIYVPDITNLIEYQTSLHEIGHFASGFGFPRNGGSYHRILLCELAAWKWAHENALLWTDDMNDEMKECLLDYWEGIPNGYFAGRVYSLRRGINQYKKVMENGYETF